MKRLISLTGIMVLGASVALGFASCKNQPGKTTPKEKAKAPPPTAPAPTKTGQGKVISPEEYWNIMLERLDLTRQNYEKSLAIYEKYKDDPQKAWPEIIKVRKANQKLVQELFTRHGLGMARNFYPRGQDRMKIQQERQQYLKDHADLDQKYLALQKELRTLREKIKEYRKIEMKMRPRPKNTAHPSHPAPGAAAGAPPANTQGAGQAGEPAPSQAGSEAK